MIKMRVAFVLQLIDEFNGKTLNNPAVVFYEGDRRLVPVRKTDGMYVFLEEFPKQAEVKIECIGFYDKYVIINQDSLNPVNPIVVVRMYGKAGGSFNYKFDLCCGALKEKKGVTFPAEVYAVRKKQLNLFFKAYREEDGKHIISFQGFCMEPLIGLAFILGEGANASIFHIKEKLGSNEYCICPINNKSVQIKQGSALFRIYRSVTDRKGSYSIPVDEGVEVLEEIFIIPSNLP